MRVLPALLVVALALPSFADTSGKRTFVDYSRFAELSALPAPRLWYVVPGAKFAAAWKDNGAALIDLATGKEFGALDSGGAGFHDAGFSADGKRMVTASNGSTVTVWDIATVKEIRKFDPFDAYS